jgi:hypothetical protein
VRDFAEVEGVETVDVLVGRDAAEHRHLVDVFRQGRLDENAVDRGVGVELVDQGEKLGLREMVTGGGWIRLVTPISAAVFSFFLT